MYRIVSTGIISVVALLWLVSFSTAFCPVSFIPGNVTCEGQGKLKWTGPYHPSDIVNPNSQKSVSIEGGCPPYTWSVSGDGYWLENDLTYDLVNIVYTDSDMDCLGSITAIDRYGNRVMGYVRAAGHWVNIGNDCVIPGPKTRTLDTRFWERVEGLYRQTQGYTNDYWNGTCLWNEPPCGNQRYSCYPDPNPGIECISLESTGMIDSYDQADFPCFWQSPEKYTEQTGNPNHSYCTNLGAVGWTSMGCIKAGLLRLYEWRCD